MVEPITIDLEFMGALRIIGVYLIPTGDGGCVLVETGPASTIDALIMGMHGVGYAVSDLRAAFVTHVHLDHAGAAGTLCRLSGCALYAHPAGVDHLVDPDCKLIPSAQRLYGDRMEMLWGEILPAPAELVHGVADGETVEIGSLTLRGWHTPGHACHHVVWEINGCVATGDVAGVRFPGSTHVLPPMPPPDIDVEDWQESIDRVRRIRPERLLLTHFGAFDDVTRHLDELELRLRRWQRCAERTLEEDGDPSDLARRLKEIDEREMAGAAVPAQAAQRYRRLCPMDGNSAGLFRYCTRRAERGGRSD